MKRIHGWLLAGSVSGVVAIGLLAVWGTGKRVRVNSVADRVESAAPIQKGSEIAKASHASTSADLIVVLRYLGCKVTSVDSLGEELGHENLARLKSTPGAVANLRRAVEALDRIAHAWDVVDAQLKTLGLSGMEERLRIARDVGVGRADPPAFISWLRRQSADWRKRDSWRVAGDTLADIADGWLVVVDCGLARRSDELVRAAVGETLFGDAWAYKDARIKGHHLAIDVQNRDR